jgi:septal ring factor EnvC (AmiA/AmiB activator)
MKNVINLLLFLSLTWLSFAQQDQKQLKREQQKLEKRISNTKKLLSKVKNNSQASLNEIRLIENQIKSREALVNLFDNQVRTAEMKIAKELKWQTEHLPKHLIKTWKDFQLKRFPKNLKELIKKSVK